MPLFSNIQSGLFRNRPASCTSESNSWAVVTAEEVSIDITMPEADDLVLRTGPVFALTGTKGDDLAIEKQGNGSFRLELSPQVVVTEGGEAVTDGITYAWEDQTHNPAIEIVSPDQRSTLVKISKDASLDTTVLGLFLSVRYKDKADGGSIRYPLLHRLHRL